MSLPLALSAVVVNNNNMSKSGVGNFTETPFRLVKGNVQPDSFLSSLMMMRRIGPKQN